MKIRQLIKEAEVGELYLGRVTSIARKPDGKEFGAFVEIFPGTDGLVHISQLAKERVRNVEDVLKEGDQVLVKVIGIDERGKIKLSRKEALGSSCAGEERIKKLSAISGQHFRTPSVFS